MGIIFVTFASIACLAVVGIIGIIASCIWIVECVKYINEGHIFEDDLDQNS